MKTEYEDWHVRGKAIKVPAAWINGRRIIVTGGWLKTATVKDEELVEGEAVEDPEGLLAQLRQRKLGADLFEFAQSPLESKPKYSYSMESDNAAVIPIKTYSEWWENLSQETRRNVKKAAKQGVTVKSVPFDDGLVRGIIEIYNETQIRQGKRFWHYGKSFEVVKAETATYLERSEFIGAYCGNELVGFIKLVYVNKSARVLHILSKNAHADKRPSNALIAKAVEICVQKGVSYLVYCKYLDGKNEKSPLTEFKRRNGFEQMCYPRYYIPVTTKGRLVLRLKLHHGLINVLPERLLALLLTFRRKCLEMLDRKRLSPAKLQ